MHHFPADFRWGVATAAYQIEGATQEDGRGESIWDRFCATPGKIKHGDTGDVACDHYHRYREDVQLLRTLGLKTYRFSIAWPRILPTGRGQVNTAGLDFYDRLIDELLAAGIEPYATLYHWDLPQALEDAYGGWGSRETAHAFVDFADVVSRRYSDRVQHWITLNEPFVSAFLGYEYGMHAPGLKDPRLAWQVSHHLLLGHGLAVPVLRANGNAQTRVGVTLNLYPIHEAGEREEDKLVARLYDGKQNRWFLDPVLRGEYPADMLAYLHENGIAPEIEPGDAEIIARPIDFLGVNYYTRALVRHKQGVAEPTPEEVRVEGHEYTSMNWEVYPPGIYELLMRLHHEYHTPQLYITENGAAFLDTIDADGHVHDARRLSYFREHLLQCQRAITDGAPLVGYFAWSFMDNFEWAEGYDQRFGLVYVDYASQRRIVKDSGTWYSETATSNGITG